ncbi:MAG: helix-turn-helix transcriptional regulator [Chloroflexota bacterium]
MRGCDDSSGVLEETKRVARVLDVIARISSRPKVWTRRALAQAFEISERRLQDDLDIVVHRLRLPLSHCRTGYYFTDTKPLPAVTFAFGEAVALLLAASVGRATAGVASAEVAAALTRLEDAFPPELRHVVATLTAPSQDPPTDGTRGRTLELLQEAIATNTTVEMTYATASRGGAEGRREVDPYALVPYVRSFHLLAHCHTRGEVRIFKVDRILELRLTGERFEVPQDFDVNAYLGESWGLMRGVGREPELVQIRFSPRAGRWVAEERWHPGQQCEWQPDGSLLFSLRVGVTPAFVRWVLYYGAEARVLAPAWLARAVRQEAIAVARAYEHIPNGEAT